MNATKEVVLSHKHNDYYTVNILYNLDHYVYFL